VSDVLARRTGSLPSALALALLLAVSLPACSEEREPEDAPPAAVTGSAEDEAGEDDEREGSSAKRGEGPAEHVGRKMDQVAGGQADHARDVGRDVDRGVRKGIRGVKKAFGR